MDYTDRSKVLAQINYLKDRILPARAKAYKNAKKQLATASMSRRRCLADWKVYRTTINVLLKLQWIKEKLRLSSASSGLS
jgi:hypothetical protein